MFISGETHFAVSASFFSNRAFSFPSWPGFVARLTHGQSQNVRPRSREPLETAWSWRTSLYQRFARRVWRDLRMCHAHRDGVPRPENITAIPPMGRPNTPRRRSHDDAGSRGHHPRMEVRSAFV